MKKGRTHWGGEERKGKSCRRYNGHCFSSITNAVLGGGEGAEEKSKDYFQTWGKTSGVSNLSRRGSS